MTLELNRATGQIDEMARVMAERASRQDNVLPAIRELLNRFAQEHAFLTELAESEAGRRLRCASPGTESLNSARSAPTSSASVTVVSADGSQIYPDRHGLAYYYVINVGSIVFRQGSGRAPTVSSAPRLFYEEADLFPGGEPITGDLISAERNLAEMRTMAGLTLAEPPAGPPRMALADGPLLIWLQEPGLPQTYQAKILAEYLGCFDQLEAADVAVAGFVSRPFSAEVVALLCLAALSPEERCAIRSLSQTEYRGLTDRALFGFLRPGERSALFVRGTAANQDFRSRGHGISLFYLNTGSELARVEVPQWVALHGDLLDLVHAVINEQCRLNHGYPYVLTRADEQAIVLGEERLALEVMIGRAMARHGLPLPEPSRKAQQKQIARWRRNG